METHYYLKFTHFYDLKEWSVQFLLNRKITYNNYFPLISIGKFLCRNKTQVDIKDNIIYIRPTIKTNNAGIHIRDIKYGKNIGTKKQFLIKTGQFLLSKIDARNGAFGVVPKECNDAIITGNFWTFDVNHSLINPYFLSLITTTKSFLDFAERASNGTTNRHYLQENLFLAEKIPLPTLEQQNNLVELYNTKIHQAESLEKEAAEINSDIENYLIEILGIKQQISNTNNAHNGFLQIIKFSNLDKWGVDKLLYENHEILCSAKFTNIKLKDILEINPSTSFEELKDETILSFIPMECISEEYGEFITQKNGSKKESNGYTKFKNGDLIWAKITPCMQNGKSAIATNLKNGFGYGSTEFYVLRNHNSQINTLYIHSLLRLPILLHSAMSSFVGSAGQQRVPKNFLENLYVPLPAIEIQNEIVSHINTQKKRIKELRTKATNLRKEAIAEFEKTIFE